MEILNSSSGLVSDAEAAMTTALPETPGELMFAHREATVPVMLLSSRPPRLVKTASLNVMWLLNGSVFVPIYTEMSLSATIESRKT